jgi:protease IV
MAKNRDKIIIIAIVGGALFLFVVFSLVAIMTSKPASDFSLTSIGDKIAIIDIKGEIDSADDVIRQLKRYEDDGSVKALVLRVDSPGGGVAASQEIFDQLMKFRSKGKHIVVSMGAVAASGGYYVACAGDTIFANPGTVTGSIGVIFSFPVIRTLMDKVGIKLEVVKSGTMKDVGSPAKEMSPEERLMLQSVIDDTYNQFVAVIVDRRKLDLDYVKSLANGSIFTGQQAKANGLVDKIGTLEDAISKAGEMADLGKHPRVIKERPYRRTIIDQLTGALGLDQIKSTYIHPWPTLEYLFNFQE